MTTLTYEWSLGPHYEPITGLVFNVLATLGGAFTTAANGLPADCGLLYWIFQLFFIHKKEGEGKSERKKVLPFIKTCPGMKTLTCCSSFPACINSKEPHVVYLLLRLLLLHLSGSEHRHTVKAVHTSNLTQISSGTCPPAFLRFLSLHHTKTTGVKVVHGALYIRAAKLWSVCCIFFFSQMAWLKPQGQWAFKERTAAQPADRKQSGDEIWAWFQPW